MSPSTGGPPAEGPRSVRLRDESIKLGQFLKLADLVDTGADAKGLLAQGLVRVNGDVETRRGRQMVDGDVVELAGRRVVLSTGH
jgi:ribosome-associated protein